ncbi:Glycosyl transferase family 2 [Fibrobacter sp. UWH9]|nr:Glycosyl transferase family 2 [Fibrobacter sp. UWH9]
MALSFEILCATMHQKDFSKIKSMNIHSNVVFANQSDENSYQEMNFEGCVAKMITTTTRGVGLNRNFALLASSKDVILFADDDTFFYDGLEENVVAAFAKLPKADVIIFGMDYSQNGQVCESIKVPTGKLPFYKSLKFGTAFLAIRRSAYLKANLIFSQLFGGGCVYLHGEDSDFIINCYRKGLRIYTYDYVLGVTSKDSSTWFSGYGEKYFFDTGALAKFAFGKLAKPYMLYMTFRVRKETEVNSIKRMRLLCAGHKSYDNLVSFDEYKRKVSANHW